MQPLENALNRTEFDALNICRTRDGEWQASIQRKGADGYNVFIEAICSDAVAAALGLACDVLPPCPVAMPGLSRA